MWIDQIVQFEPGRRMVAVKQVSAAEDHLHDHFAAEGGLAPQPVMPASLMIEGMAQTAGILVGSVNRFREKVILAKIIVARFDADVTPGQSIRYDASIDRIDTAGAVTTGIVERRTAAGDTWETIGQVNLMYSHIDNNRSGLDFPEHNFVFSDNFRGILRQAGLEALADA
jgi:3-hydroxyacyl-[acyl-carrier-protein] dehydratase